jgi:hypothetical protein
MVSFRCSTRAFRVRLFEDIAEWRSCHAGARLANITRHDGQQFQPGIYTLRVLGTTAAGASVDFTTTVPIGLAGGDTLPSAPLPRGVTGTNGQPVH